MSLQVQGTNDSSIVSKCSMVDRGYFDDKYIHCFVEKTSRRSPIINIGYYVRATVINAVLNDFVTSSYGAVQFVSLGAGFDTNFFQLTDTPTKCSIAYYEIDLSNVVKRKKKIILNSKVLLEKLDNVEDCNSDDLKSSNYHLLVCDLSNIPKTQKCLIDAGFNPQLPTLFLAECSITYMNEKSSTNLINWAGHFVRHGTFVTYEQINPHDGFGMKMLLHFNTQQSPLLSLAKYPTTADQKQRYEDNGWSNCDVIPAWTAFTKILSDEEMHSKLSLEPFDEWEEWHLKCNHYALAVARNGTLNDWRPFILNAGFENIGLVNDLNASQPFEWKLKHKSCIHRYAHTSVLFGKKNRYILTIGGFGTQDNGPHKRFGDVMCSGYSPPANSDVIGKVMCGDLSSKGFMHHTCTVLTRNEGESCEEMSAILYGGRTSPGRSVNSCPLLIKCCVIEEKMTLTSKELVGSVGYLEKMTPRWRHSACVMDIDSAKWFVVFGGCSAGLKILDDLWLLEISASDTSSPIKTDWICASSKNHSTTDNLLVESEHKPEARFSHSSVVWKESNMLVTCGLGANNTVFNDVWLWNFKSRLWKNLEIIGLISRYSHTSNVSNNSLVLVGGVTTMCGIIPGVAVIDLDLLICREYRLPVLDPSSPIMLHNHSTIYDDEEDSLVVIGGGGNCFSFGTHLNSQFVEIPLHQFLN